MKLLIYILIIFFIILIVDQYFFTKTKMNYIEGLANPTSCQYQPYNTNTNDPTNVGILAQQNAGNIQVLEGQINNLTNLQTEVTDISGNVATLTSQVNTIQQQVNALTQQQTAAANNISKKLPVTGAN